MQGFHLDRVEHAFGGRCRTQLKHVEEFRRVTAQRRVALSDAVQEVESFGLRQPLRLGDARGEVLPRHYRLDRRERVVAGLLGIEQRLANTGLEAHLVVDRLARRLELLLMLVFRSGE